MSEVKRYLAKISWTQIETEEHPAGEFVRWSDYARLQAEVERLRKAGDWMREALEEGPIDYQCRIDRWNAAKEGKPSA